jgi:uncharacterized protein YceK
MRQIKLAQIITAILVVLIFYGCATIIHGTKQEIGISSSPTGAKVSVDNDSVGTTPLFVKLKRKEDYIITIEMPGYRKAQLTITKSVSGWIWGNIVFGGLIGLAIDAGSGGMYNLSPEQLNAELKEDSSIAVSEKDGLYILSVLHADPNWHRVGNLTETNSK